MDRSNVLTLVAVTYTTDSIGQKIPHESTRNVFCNVASISQAEWYSGGQAGLKPEYKATVFAPDYNDEGIAILDGKRYAIYRTYRKADETLELYLERKVGV